MSETLKIEIPEGFEIDSFDPKAGEIKFKRKPKKVTERIKTLADVLEECHINKETFDKCCEGLPEDEVAYRVLKLVARALNEGWEPDWSNMQQYKYYPYF